MATKEQVLDLMNILDDLRVEIGPFIDEDDELLNVVKGDLDHIYALAGHVVLLLGQRL